MDFSTAKETLYNKFREDSYLASAAAEAININARLNILNSIKEESDLASMEKIKEAEHDHSKENGIIDISRRIRKLMNTYTE